MEAKLAGARQDTMMGTDDGGRCDPASLRIVGRSFDAERSLYGIHDAFLSDVTFGGPADGESPLKEVSGICVTGSRFLLRYPLWHASGFSLSGCLFGETSRASMWYSHSGDISETRIASPKAVRECRKISLTGCDIASDEFGWMSSDVTLRDCSLSGEYAFLHSEGIVASNLSFSGKYSFQYVRGAEIRDSVLDTKDAFWHSDGVPVYDSVIRGEYLGWYSRNLTLVRCRIEGTQPFVHCENLVLIDCEMVGCDLAFEGSSVDANVIGTIDSIRPPKSGIIMADGIGEVVDDTIGESTVTVILRPSVA